MLEKAKALRKRYGGCIGEMIRVFTVFKLFVNKLPCVVICFLRVRVSLELVVCHGRPQGGNTSLGVGVSRTGAVGRVIIDIPASVPYCVGDLP